MNAMPTFAIFHKAAFLGVVSAVSHKQATRRAAGRFPGKRLVVELSQTVESRDADRVGANKAFQAKRAPYATGDFESRRAAAIAAWAAA